MHFWVHEALLLQIVKELMDEELRRISSARRSVHAQGRRLLPERRRTSSGGGSGVANGYDWRGANRITAVTANAELGDVAHVVPQLVLVRARAALDLDPHDDVARVLVGPASEAKL